MPNLTLGERIMNLPPNSQRQILSTLPNVSLNNISRSLSINERTRNIVIQEMRKRQRNLLAQQAQQVQPLFQQFQPPNWINQYGSFL